jgi:hypothetical protein
MRCGGTGKVRHTSRRKAMLAHDAVNNAGLAVYHCASCKGWHLGTSNRPWHQQARIDQLLGLRP